MPSMRVTVSADPRFLEAIDAGIRALGEAEGTSVTYDAFALLALEALKGRSAIDALPTLTRYQPPSQNGGLEFRHPGGTEATYQELFHVMSLSMPRGVEIVSWNPEQILTAALTLYSEGLSSRGRLRLV
ncbi:hypothetical protein QOZ96_003343 [Brevundimonas nasdae]|uniref:hypothetical protein n=1 Tax=Brevundimonas nasdae TaxID=172043 RepID=UPI001914C53C|nr:hypothetical protein [Brevundimonas nasdae]MBK6026820.1 hypothetical protein [Brevundimonas nasdae]MDQ0453373.1 hypothetical protein [Brevundimonas nasdae]